MGWDVCWLEMMRVIRVLQYSNVFVATLLDSVTNGDGWEDLVGNNG